MKNIISRNKPELIDKHQNSRKEPHDEAVDVIYILGPGHCGSTLLNLCLDRHSAIIGVSEIVTLNRKHRGWFNNKNVFDSPFWCEVDRIIRENNPFGLEDISFDPAGVSKGTHHAVVNQNHAALKAVLAASGKRVVADASKDPRRLKMMLQSPLFRVQVIYLIRDCRAVVNAYHRKYGDWWSPCRKLIKLDRKAAHLSRHNPEMWLNLRYEDMVSDIEKILRRVCILSEISFEPEMSKPDINNFKGLGGNRLRNQPVENITLDTAWQAEMPRAIMWLTALATWKVNQRHGYETTYNVRRLAFA